MCDDEGGTHRAILFRMSRTSRMRVPFFAALLSSIAAFGALGANFVLSGGAESTDELIAGVGRGLLVTDFWYTRILDPKTQVVTGLTRNGVWLVEDGRIVRPVTNMRFTQSFVEALAPGAVRAVGSEQALLVGGWDSVYLVPALHLASWNFTGGAKG